MQQITIEDRIYDAVSTEAARLNLNIDTYVSTVLMREIGLSVKDEVARRIREAGSPGKALIGLFSDIPDVMDAIVADAMESRARQWQT